MFPKSELGTIQYVLPKYAGPLCCLRSELLDNNLLEEERTVVNVYDVVNGGPTYIRVTQMSLLSKQGDA